MGCLTYEFEKVMKYLISKGIPEDKIYSSLDTPDDVIIEIEN
jgi:hypothetical protein